MPASTDIRFDVDPQEALDHFGGKGLAPSDHYSDVWGKQHCKDFTVAKMLDMDLLNEVKDSLDKALREGKTFEDWRKEIEPKMRKAGWWGKKEIIDPETGKKRLVQLGSPRRLELIFRQNMLDAYNAGRRQRLEEQAHRRPWWRYESVLDDRTRPEHRAWDGTLLRHDHPWWQTHFPPNGYLCRCTVSSMSDGKRQRRGLAATPDDQIPGYGETRKWTNPRTGEVFDVPVGQDPGFDHMPGDPARMGESLAAKMAAAPQGLANEVAESLLKGEAFQEFFNNPVPGVEMLAGVVPEQVQEAIGAQGPGAFLSGDTLQKNKDHHPELAMEDYARIPELLSTPDLVIQDWEQTVFCLKKDGEWWLAAVKATKTGQRNYVTSFRRTRWADIQRRLTNGEVLLGEVAE